MTQHETEEDQRSTMPTVPWSVQLTTADGEVHDLTRELAVLYDALVGSMDWGSGFLDVEDARALFRIARLCDLDSPGTYDAGGHCRAVLVDADGNALTQHPRPNDPVANRYVTTASRMLTKHGDAYTLGRSLGARDGTAVAVVLVNAVTGDIIDTLVLTSPVQVQAAVWVNHGSVVVPVPAGQAVTQ